MDVSKVDLWKTALERSPDPAAFINLRGDFVFCNTSFCKLVGRHGSDLKTKRIQDVTDQSDSGGDFREIELIGKGEKDESFSDKTLVGKQNEKMQVTQALYGYPLFGDREGCIVYIKTKKDQLADEFRDKFKQVQEYVAELQRNDGHDRIAEAVQKNEQKIDALVNALVSKGEVQVGDNIKTGGDYTGNNKTTITNSTKLIMAVVAGGFAFLGVCAVAVVWIVFYVNGNPDMPKPEVNAPKVEAPK